ncbi:helix-turn-helix domain-containing protein [Labrys sp. WJW]|uniref:helix-turn-helix domain-containing protein n=1 Tax=Labrys sp. WJW TaxID=1737983 RepID=UPI000A81EE5B|nr:helix-turn-helix domain-containing protein [Labrys sp. WJW]
MDLPESKMQERSYYQPTANSVENLPTVLQTFHNTPRVMLSPHWHAQVEVNFIVQGWVHYRMAGYELRLAAGDMVLFWGGLPHQMDDASDDAIYAGAHLPLVHFFRLRLPEEVPARLMAGATLLIRETDSSDGANFARWNGYTRSGDMVRAQHAVSELLLRLERVRFEPYALLPSLDAHAGQASTADPQALRHVRNLCDFIADNFLDDIDSADIAAAAGLHPKYAMSLFKKCTGMTLNDYVSLLRLSYAQARLISGDGNILRVAMESGFGSLSGFNKSFRRIAGMSPSDFRRSGQGERPILAPVEPGAAPQA